MDRPALVFDGSATPVVNEGHIVPRTYQRAWEGEHRQVAVHSIQSSECTLESTKVVGTRGPYYRRIRPEGNQTDDIEASMAYVEDKSTRPLRELIKGRPITPERKGAIAQLLGLQLLRGPATFQQRDEILRPTLEGIEAKDMRPKHLASAGGDVDLARSEVVDTILGPTNRFVMMLQYVPKIASIMALMRWHVLRFDGPVLAYSDHPVVLWPMYLEQAEPFVRQGLGPLTTREVRVPIAPHVAILMNWIDRKDESDVRIDPSAALEINAFTISQAQDQWMHQPKSEPEIGKGIFRPLSRLIDPGYDYETAYASYRRVQAEHFLSRARTRTWVNDIDVLVDPFTSRP